MHPRVAYAGEREEWSVRLGGVDMPAGTRVRLLLQGGRGNAADWEWPQIHDPAGPGYTSARVLGCEASVSVRPLSWEKDKQIGVEVEIGEPGVGAGDVVEIVLGDRSQGGPGIRPQTFSQRRKPLKIFIALPGQELREVANPPVLQVLGGPPDRVRLFIPSIVGGDETFDGLIRIEDPHGNVASYYAGHLHLTAQGASVGIPSPVTIEQGDSCLRPVAGLRVREPNGYFRIRVRQPGDEGFTLSNPCIVAGEDYPYRLYWGILHGHTELSDGIGTPEEYFTHLRDGCRLDFGALGDHDHLWETTDEMWRHAQRVTAEFNEPGRFVTILGYEWAKWRRNGDGDRCVYYLDDYQPMYRSDDGHYPRPWHLFRALHDNHLGRALVIPHHTASTGNFCDFSQHDPIHERLIEIYSEWGSSERSVHDGNPFPLKPPGLPEGRDAAGVPLDAGEEPCGFVQRALRLGWRVGFTAGGDDHRCHAGDATRHGPEPFRYRDGLLGVWATELTREAIWTALYERRTVATTGARIILAWALADEFMGSDIPVRVGDGLMMARQMTIEAYAEAPIASIEIVRNNEVVYQTRPGEESAVIEWADEEPLDLIALRPHRRRPAFVFYYIRLLQADGEMAWASPIWLTLEE